MHTILVPFDGSGHALKALHIACDLAEKYNGRVVLLHVLASDKSADELLRLPAAKDYGQVITQQLRLARSGPPLGEALLKAVGSKIVSQAAERASRRGVKCELLPPGTGPAAECILAAARQLPANTIVMGCRGLSGEKAATFGSVSHAVFAAAECTCISVK